MPRLLPVVPGVVKHQLYTAYVGNEAALKSPTYNEAVFTFWTSGGVSPVAQARIDAEQTAIRDWVQATARAQWSPRMQATGIRSWDYGLDPAPRTVFRIWPTIVGTLVVATEVADWGAAAQSWIGAIRTQAVGSVVRNRQNGRLFWPMAGYNGTVLAPSAANVAAALNTLRTARLNGTGLVGTWSVVSFYAGGVPRVAPLVLPVDHVIVQRLGYQQRRNRRYGPYPRGA